MNIQTDALAHLANIKYYAGEVRKLAKGQFEQDVEGLNFLASDNGADYLAGLAELDAFVEKVDFFAFCAELKIEHLSRIRPPAAIKV